MSGRRNPDARPLPPGWIAQYDSNYNTWFYVNTRTTPPTSSWSHPLDTQTQRPSNNYGSQFNAPAGPPPGQNSYDNDYGQGRSQWSSPPPQSSWGSQNQGQWQPQSPGSYNQGGGYGYGGQQPTYGGPQPSRYPSGASQPSWGGPPQGPTYGQGQGYNYGPPQQERYLGNDPQPMVAQQPAQQPRRGAGIGTIALAGGAGLIGGALLENAFEDHEEKDYDESYEQGAQNQYDQDNFGGDDGY